MESDVRCDIPRQNLREQPPRLLPPLLAQCRQRGDTGDEEHFHESGCSWRQPLQQERKIAWKSSGGVAVNNTNKYQTCFDNEEGLSQRWAIRSLKNGSTLPSNKQRAKPLDMW